MSEWLKEAVLKTVVPQGTGGSNPPCSEHNEEFYTVKLLVIMFKGDSKRSVSGKNIKALAL